MIRPRLIFCLIGLLVSLAYQVPSAFADDAPKEGTYDSLFLREFADIMREQWPQSRIFLELTVEDIFPESFLNQIREHGDQLRLEIRPSNILEGGIELFFSTKYRYNIARISLAKGNDTEVIQVDNLKLASPNYLRRTGTATSRHQGRKEKGLPFEVFKEVKNRLFSRIRAAGYNQIEISGADDFEVYLLYHKLLRANPTTKFGRQLMTQLEEIFKYEGWQKFLEHPLSLGAFSQMLEPTLLNDPDENSLKAFLGLDHRPSPGILVEFAEDYGKLQKKAAKTGQDLVHPTLGTIAHKVGSEIFIFAPLLKEKNPALQYPVVTWYGLFILHRQDMKLRIELTP